MKKIIFGLYIMTITCLLQAQNISINNTNTLANISAILDLNTGHTYTSPNGEGLLIPNVPLASATDATTISSPATSLLVYVPSGSGLSPSGYYYNSGTSGSPNWILLAANAWSLTGNSATTPGTNFLGTTDANALCFKVDNIISGWIDNGGMFFSNANTYYGYSAGNLPASSGMLNVGIGSEALYSNTSGADNTAIGVNALSSNTSGSSNIAIGFEALYQSTTTSANTAIGVDALSSSITGNGNTAVGYSALADNTSGYDNTALGANGLQSNRSGGENTAFGLDALNDNVSGSYNTAVGSESLFNNASSLNTAVGYNSLKNTGSGQGNSGIGYDALALNTSGSSNAAVGTDALYGTSTGDYNAAIGDSAGAKNTTGVGNTFIGYMAGDNNTTGSNNVFIGYDVQGISASTSNQCIIGNSSNTLLGFFGALEPYYSSNYQAGTTGQVLISQGTGVSPQWSNPTIIKYTSTHTPSNAGEIWLSVVNGDTTNCFYDGKKIDSTTLNLNGISWSPSFTGFSSAPSSVVARYWWQGNNVCHIYMTMTNGTSNSTSFTFTLPFKALLTATNLHSVVATNGGNFTFVEDGYTANSTTCTLLVNENATGWTASSSKGAQLDCTYIAQ